jgi:hypothetical protein
MYSSELLRKIDIDYLTKTTDYVKCLQNQSDGRISARDKKFYRKRIYSLTKELLTTAADDADNSSDITPTNDLIANINPEVTNQFEKYINCCIRYFQSLDHNDIIQDDYKLLDTACDADQNVVMQTQEEADDLLIRSVNVTTSTLDKYVIRTKLKIKKNDMIIPKQKNINLRAPELKRKGVKFSGKKKNIRNTYEGANQKEAPAEETCQNI